MPAPPVAPALPLAGLPHTHISHGRASDAPDSRVARAFAPFSSSPRRRGPIPDSRCRRAGGELVGLPRLPREPRLGPGSGAGATPAFARAGGWGNATPRHRAQMCGRKQTIFLLLPYLTWKLWTPVSSPWIQRVIMHVKHSFYGHSTIELRSTSCENCSIWVLDTVHETRCMDRLNGMSMKAAYGRRCNHVIWIMVWNCRRLSEFDGAYG